MRDAKCRVTFSTGTKPSRSAFTEKPPRPARDAGRSDIARTCALSPTPNGARHAAKRSRDLNTTARPPASSAGTVTSLDQRTVPPNLDIADQGQCATAAPTKTPTREALVTTQPSGEKRQLQHQRKGDGEDPGNQGRRHAKTATNPPAADHTKVSSWARVASSPPPSLAIQALKAENIQLKRELEQLRQEIRTIKAERSLVTPAPPQDGDAGSEEPMIQTADPEDRQQVYRTHLWRTRVSRALFERKTHSLNLPCFRK